MLMLQRQPNKDVTDLRIFENDRGRLHERRLHIQTVLLSVEFNSDVSKK